MKICLVSDSYYPLPGGVTEHIHHLAKELRKMGHTVIILTAHYPQGSERDGEGVHRVGRSVLVPINQSYAAITIGREVVREVRDFLYAEAFDIVHTHGPLAPTLPLLALWYSNCVNIATFHAARERTPQYAMLSWALRGLFRRIDGRIAVSEVARQSVARYFPGDYTIIPNGVDTKRFRPDVASIKHYSDGKPRILFLGRFDPRKGLPYLLRAMPEVLRAIPEARLIVVGGGRLRSRLEASVPRMAKSAIEFVGQVPPDMVARYFTSVDVFCSPAIERESFGIILLEAMASGTPVVAFDNPGYRGVINHRDDGLLVENKNCSALAASLIEVLKDPCLRASLRARGLEKASQFCWPRVVGEVESFYRHVMEKRIGIETARPAA